MLRYRTAASLALALELDSSEEQPTWSVAEESVPARMDTSSGGCTEGEGTEEKRGVSMMAIVSFMD